MCKPAPRPRRNPIGLLGLSLLLCLLANGGITAHAADQASTGVYTLDDLLALARRYNPGLGAGDRATASVRAQVGEAERNWLPSGELTSLLAPSPKIKCSPDPYNCITTPDIRDATLKLDGVFTRTQLTFTQPVYTFGKISAGVEAAEAGVEASRGREQAMAAELDYNVRRAYYGFKLARELQATLKEGLGYVQQAEDMVQKDLDEGAGNMTITDKLRLQSTRADVEAQMSEVGRGLEIARAGLRALIGPEGPREIDVDAQALEKLAVPTRPLSFYEEQARLTRPEVRALDYFVRSKRKSADLEWAKQLPDIAIVGTATFAYASSVDNPQNAFANDPYNTLSGGLAAALRVPLDFGPRNARAAKALADAEEAAFRRREALGGIGFEVSKAYIELNEANSRIETLAKGEKLSRRWLTAIVQKMDLGLAETREVTDALRAYFTMRARYLQAVHDFDLAASALTRATGSKVTTN
ncbi:MAG: TolC family protein [Deltaproteobacteria bacterium]|nr:TolC family protein [Deltaproteobacteria bacterium]